MARVVASPGPSFALAPGFGGCKIIERVCIAVWFARMHTHAHKHATCAHVMQVGQLFMDATVPNGGGGAVGGGDLPSTAVPRLGVPGFNWMSQGNVCVMQWHVQVVQHLACRASLAFTAKLKAAPADHWCQQRGQSCSCSKLPLAFSARRLLLTPAAAGRCQRRRLHTITGILRCSSLSLQGTVSQVLKRWFSCPVQDCADTGVTAQALAHL